MNLNQNNHKLQIWGGLECTINRVGDIYFDQFEKSGHIHRIKDLEMIAELGIKTIRYPVQWERVAPKGLKNADWSWTDERIFKLKELGINTIAGLLHHGSGPAFTNLTDPDFPRYLSEFAAAAAERYPWIKDFTPVNEPLTTARFSGLYGIWYPHGKDDLTFADCFLTQCKGIIEAMKVIKKINPSASLIQTEDMGKTYSTPKLDYQAKFENERRWLTFDLLCGRVQPGHPMWQYLSYIGVKEQQLEYFVENNYSPDILGINHYVTSERYLDHRMELYPSQTYGGNGKDSYADVEAVRVMTAERHGLKNILEEVAARYDLPIALTEVHLGCTREEQARWLQQKHETVIQLKNKGMNIQAITIWSILGMYNWHVLLTRDENYYEPGVFDVRSEPVPRPTLLAAMTKAYCNGKKFLHPLAKNPGWWQRPERFYNKIEVRDKPSKPVSPRLDTGLKKNSPLVITGARGTLAKAFARACEVRGIHYRLLTRQELDIADVLSVKDGLEKIAPWAVINAAGFVRVDEAEEQRDLCLRENSEGPAILAQACLDQGIKFMTFSSDLVFNGKSRKPYLESCQPKPLNIYGLSKMEAEICVIKNNPSALIIRTSSFFGPWDQYNFLTEALKNISKGNIFKASSDHVVSPTYVPDLVSACLDLLIDAESGIWHLSNPSEVTWAEFAITAAERSGFDASLIKPVPSSVLGYKAERPLYSVLGSERATMLLPELDNAINRYLQAMNFALV
jgi:dTDP-4-dehydrorhamnose reductase